VDIFFVDVVKLNNSFKCIPSTLEKIVKNNSFDMDEMNLEYYVLLLMNAHGCVGELFSFLEYDIGE